MEFLGHNGSRIRGAFQPAVDVWGRRKHFARHGGVVSILRGSPLMTQDVDVVYSTSEDNTRRLAKASG